MPCLNPIAAGLVYDPEAAGAECDKCPLNTGRKIVVPPSRIGGRALFVGIEPGLTEEETGIPYTGESGRENDRAIRAAGVRRENFDFSNTRLCRSGVVDKKVDAAATAACAPRLWREIARATAVFPQGKEPLALISTRSPELEGKASLQRTRGLPFTVAPFGASSPLRVPALASYHPAAVLRQRALTVELRADVVKMARLAARRLQWSGCDVLFDPTHSTIRATFDEWIATRAIVSCDIETVPAVHGQDPDPLTDLVRCIGFSTSGGKATKGKALVIGIRSVEHTNRPWACPVHAAVAEVQRFFDAVAAGQARMSWHNGLQYDGVVLKQAGFRVPPPSVVLDTIYAHHVCDPEGFHGLESVAAQLTDAPAWKPANHDGWTDLGDQALHVYCTIDTAVTAEATPKLAAELQRADLIDAYLSDIKYGEACNAMHAAGVGLSLAEVARHRARLESRAAVAIAEARAAAGRDVDLLSPTSVRDYLFGDEGLAPTQFVTQQGLPSTDAKAINELLTRRLPGNVAAFLDALVRYRRAMKWVATYLDLNGSLRLGADGRVHAQWTAFRQKVGRCSAANPNWQQLPGLKLDTDSLQSIVEAAPGNVLVYADMPQFHLRLIAGITRDELWLEAFKANKDVHLINGSTFFHKPVDKVEKFEREFAKIAAYLIVYAGSFDTFRNALRQVYSAKTGKRPYADMPDELMRGAYDSFRKQHGRIVNWWADSLKRFRARGFATTELLRRRNYFRSTIGEDIEKCMSEIVNYDVLGLEGDIMGGSGAAGKFLDAVPPFVYGPGLIMHKHDAMIAEVKAEYAETGKRALLDAMSFTYRDVPIIPETKSGRSLHDLH